MPHQDNLERGINETQPPPARSGGAARPLMDNQRARVAMPPDKSRATSASSASRQGKRRNDDSWRASLEQKINNFAIMSNPAGGVARGQTYAGRSPLYNGAAASPTPIRTPSNSVVANAQSAGRVAGNTAAGSQNERRLISNSVASRGKRVVASQNGDHRPLKSVICSPHIMNGHTERGDAGGTAASKNDVIDLTGDVSGEDSGQPVSRGKSDTVHRHDSNKMQTTLPVENSQPPAIHAVGHPSNQQHQEESRSLLKPRDTTDAVPSNNRDKHQVPRTLFNVSKPEQPSPSPSSAQKRRKTENVEAKCSASSRVPQLELDERKSLASNKKRNFSTIDIHAAASELSTNTEKVGQSSTEGSLRHAISISAEESDNSRVSDVVAQNNNSEGKMLPSASTKIAPKTVFDVRPKFSQMNMDFFRSVGIVNVQDLLDCDPDDLCPLLLAFDKFKAACAFFVWKNRLNLPKDSSNLVFFHDLYRPTSAKKSILNWKRAAEAWCKKTHNTNSNDVQVKKACSSSEMTEESSDTAEIKADGLLPLQNIISSHEAQMLKNHCNIKSVQQLLRADHKVIIRQLTGVIGVNFRGRPQNEVECIVEGMLYSWLLRAQEALQVDSNHNNETGRLPDVGAIFSGSTPTMECPVVFQTPLGYVDTNFIRSQKNILCDEHLANCDVTRLAPRYVAYMKQKHQKISLAAARKVINKWRRDSSFVLGKCSKEDLRETLPRNTRLDKISALDVMNSVPNLCKTEVDDENDGLPRRTIMTYDGTNDVLYKFEVSVRDSECSEDAGKGAFLTFRGAKVLKASSKKKKKQVVPSPQTREPMEALFSTTRSGVTVTLKGANLHEDEHRYGPESDDSVGFYREFMLDDFVDAKDNITFSSKHQGCALIELGRYSPLLKEDRKTGHVFAIKDFIFSYEPSSWRFDVEEEIDGCSQVVDFTSDTTGAPHGVAQRNLSMYVNEVGHNMDLVENVTARTVSSRSVSYFIFIDEPMAKGETTELLVNYKEHYETMRERRGYGKANMFDGVKSDACDVTRVKRNLDDRSLMEASILKLTEDELRQVFDFIKHHVRDGVEAATSTFTTNCEAKNCNLLRQCIARRRMHWISTIMEKRFHQLLGRGNAFLQHLDDSSDECIFQVGMHVYVHDWPKDDLRPPYTGLASIISICKDKHERNVFEVSLSDGKYIKSVPEAVVTLPTDDDFTDVPQRAYANWKKKKKERDLPRMRMELLNEINIKWDPSFVRNISDPDMQTKVLQSLRWEFSEELLFVLLKNRRISRPFDEEMWCPFSVTLLTKCLHLIADLFLMAIDKQNVIQSMLGLASNTANAMKNVVTNQELSLSDLAFLEKSDSQAENARVLVVDHPNRLAIEDYLRDPHPIDFDWYVTNQIVLAVHPLATLFDWGQLYSIEKLCESIGLKDDASGLNFYKSKVQEWQPLL